MKYIDADKLIAEIERLTNQKKKQLKMFSAEDYSCSVASSISCELWGNEEVLPIIKSLQQEQPKVDLEKEIDEYFKDWVQDDADSISNGGVITDKYQYATIFDCRRIARHFYELGRTRKEE